MKFLTILIFSFVTATTGFTSMNRITNIFHMKPIYKYSNLCNQFSFSMIVFTILELSKS